MPNPTSAYRTNTKKGTNAINNKGVIPIGSQASTNKIAGSITQKPQWAILNPSPQFDYLRIWHLPKLQQIHLLVLDFQNGLQPLLMYR